MESIFVGDIPQDGHGKPATFAQVQADGGAVRWQDDRNAPTSTTGFKLADGEERRMDSDPNKIVLYVAAGVKISFYVSE